jgi:hypothetical protein
MVEPSKDVRCSNMQIEQRKVTRQLKSIDFICPWRFAACA